LRLDPLALAHRAYLAGDELRDPLLDDRALGVREGIEHEPPGADEIALVTGFGSGFYRSPTLCRGKYRAHRIRGAVLGEQDPVAMFLRQLLPRRVDVVSQ